MVVGGHPNTPRGCCPTGTLPWPGSARARLPHPHRWLCRIGPGLPRGDGTQRRGALPGIAGHGWVSLGITGCHWALRLPRCWGNAPICPQSLDLWCFDVFALNRVTDDHSLRTIVFELFTRHNLNSRFKVRPCPCPRRGRVPGTFQWLCTRECIRERVCPYRRSPPSS